MQNASKINATKQGMCDKRGANARHVRKEEKTLCKEQKRKTKPFHKKIITKKLPWKKRRLLPW
jgi:hypothetical protein